MPEHPPLPSPASSIRSRAADWSYRPDAASSPTAATRGARSTRIRPSAADETRVHLLLIDVQKDFCFPEGTLYVAGRTGRGAIDDSRRIAEFVYRNLGALTDITTTLDTHLAYQIFFPCFWLDKADQPLDRRSARSPPTRSPPARCARTRRWRSGCAAATTRGCASRSRYYCQELERAGKYQLYLWPPHCLLGTDGHALAGVVHEARLFHAFARGAQSYVEVKGGNPLTENYSVLRPEVLVALRRRAARAAQHAVPPDAARRRRGGDRRPGREPLREELDRRPARRDRRAGSGAREARSTC